MNNIFITILSSAAISTFLVGGLTWLLRNWISERLKSAIKFEYDQKLKTFAEDLSRSSEDRTRKLERLLKHYERQVEEFYGPLWNMVHQLYVCNETKYKIITRLDRDKAAKVEHYYQNNYFIPLHDEIRQIIKTKLYLVDGAEMPPSFYEYLRHAIQERDQRELAQQLGVDTSFLPGVPWPTGFHDCIKNGFDTAMRRYEACLEGLRTESK
jgi:hypothetical protein